jgi:hypothetical protein
MFKKEQETFLDKAEAFLRKGGLSDKTIHNILIGFHLFIIILSFFLFLFGSKPWFYLIVFLNISVYLSFLIFNSCILSKLERRFSDIDFNIIDPILVLIKKEQNKENRKKYTKLSFMFLSLSILIVYYIRFGKSKTPNVKIPDII